MIPLEMTGMIRYCHPPTPHVGLHRQCRDPYRTRQYYLEAKKIRNLVYFPSMLRTMTSKFHVYRLIRRLWVKAIRIILRDYCPYLVHIILDMICPDRYEPIPLYFTKFYQLHLSYKNLSTPIRFKQLAGRLVTLGYPEREIPEVDYEYESYLLKFYPYRHTEITDLYRQLCQKRIQRKWHIILSYLPFHLRDDVSNWEHHLYSNQMCFTLQAFHRRHFISLEEHSLITSWIEKMKYPSH